jgi:Lrp/AsnC family transcriptional regulator
MLRQVTERGALCTTEPGLGWRDGPEKKQLATPRGRPHQMGRAFMHQDASVPPGRWMSIFFSELVFWRPMTAKLYSDWGAHQPIRELHMTERDLDRLDREILRLIANDASLSLAEIAGRIGLTATPCWKRIRRMEEAGIISGRITRIDPAKVGLPVAVFVEVETADHSAGWLQRFADVVRETPEVVDAWRMSGDVDYLLRVVVPDIAAYDVFYRKLIAAVPLRNVTSRFSMERLKEATLPI